MLETVREYAIDRLQQAGEAEETYRAFADHWSNVISPLSADLKAGDPDATAMVEADNANIRAALAWALGGQPGQGFVDPADPTLGAQLCTAMGSYWALTQVREGSAWMTRALECAADEPAAVRAALSFLGGVLYDEEGRDAEAQASLTKAMELFREVGDRSGEARAVNSLGVVARGRGELDQARTFFRSGLELRQDLGMPISNTLNNLGVVATDAGDLEAARDYFQRELELDEAAGDRDGVATARSNLAGVALRSGDVETAEGFLRQSLPGFVEVADTVGIAEDLERFAEAALLREDLQRAAMLYAAATQYREEEGVPQPRIDRERQDELIADIRSRLAPEEFDVSWSRGQSMTSEAAVEEALA
jgi:tetratricopeptide (TPR) repeat protein